jgi:hypothetical protein
MHPNLAASMLKFINHKNVVSVFDNNNFLCVQKELLLKHWRNMFKKVLSTAITVTLNSLKIHNILRYGNSNVQ